MALTRELGEVPQCKLNAAHRAAVAACDDDDGARDGLVSGVGTCRFDPKALLGTQTECGLIDTREAEVIRQIWEGPRRRDGSPLWNGIDRAALIHAPQPPADWASPFSDGKAPDADNFSLAAFEALFDQFVERYGAVMAPRVRTWVHSPSAAKPSFGTASPMTSSPLQEACITSSRFVARWVSVRLTISCASILHRVLGIAAGAMGRNLSRCSSR